MRGRCVYSYRFSGSKLDVVAVQARIIEITRDFKILALPMTPFFRDLKHQDPFIFCISSSMPAIHREPELRDHQ